MSVTTFPAVSFERVLREVRARYVTGLTATPYRAMGYQEEDRGARLPFGAVSPSPGVGSSP